MPDPTPTYTLHTPDGPIAFDADLAAITLAPFGVAGVRSWTAAGQAVRVEQLALDAFLAHRDPEAERAGE